MINTNTLETLLNLHNENQQNTEKILADIFQRKEEAEKKLSDFIMSREQYQHNFQEQSKKGINSFNYNQYILFINNMERGINEQKQIIDNIEKEFDIAKLKWIEAKKQVLIYSNIQHKQKKIEINTILKKEQKQQDEWCLRQYYEKNKEK